MWFLRQLKVKEGGGGRRSPSERLNQRRGSNLAEVVKARL